MAVNPPVKVIADQQSWRPFDRSGIEYDQTKLLSMPGSLAECDGYREHCTEEEGWVVERSYLCNWSDAAAAIQWLRGYSMGSPGGGGLTRIPPAQDPYRPWLYCMRAELVEPLGVPLQDPGLVTAAAPEADAGEAGAITAVDSGQVITVGGENPAGTGLDTITVTGPEEEQQAAEEEDEEDIPLVDEEEPIEEVAITYVPGTVWAEKGYQFESDYFSDGKAKIRAVFRAVPYVIRSDAQQAVSADAATQGELCRYVERVPRYAIQGMQLFNIAKSGRLIFVGSVTAENPGGILIPEAGMLLIPTASFHYIWHDVPFYPAAAIEAVQGKVNPLPFDGVAGWPTFPPGTLLCQAPEIQMMRNASGQASFNVTWILDYRAAGWNRWPVAPGTRGVAVGPDGFAAATFGGGPPAPDGSNLVFKPADFRLLFAAGPQILFV